MKVLHTHLYDLCYLKGAQCNKEWKQPHEKKLRQYNVSDMERILVPSGESVSELEETHRWKRARSVLRRRRQEHDGYTNS